MLRLLQHIATKIATRRSPSNTLRSVRIGIISSNENIVQTFAQNILTHAYFDTLEALSPTLQKIVQPLLHQWYSQSNGRRILIPNSEHLSGESGTLELILLDNSQDRSIQINAALLLLPTTLESTTELMLKDVLHEMPTDVPLNVLCIIGQNDINNNVHDQDSPITHYDQDDIAIKAAAAIYNINTETTDLDLYSIRFGRVDQGEQAWRSLFLAQHSVLYPSGRLKGARFTQACGIIYASCCKNGIFDWSTFARVVFGENNLTDVGKKELMYSTGQPESVKDVVHWFERLTQSGKASLVWVALRNFGFDGNLVKGRVKHYKSQIPTRLVK